MKLNWWIRFWRKCIRKTEERRNGSELIEELERALDALEGHYTILINDLPPEPGMGIERGDRITIVGDGPDDEIDTLRMGIRDEP